MSGFNSKRRQQFLTEDQVNYLTGLCNRLIVGHEQNLNKPEGDDIGWYVGQIKGIADCKYYLFILNYTAGQSIAPLRQEVEQVIVAYERYAEKLREYSNDPNEMAFPIRSVDGYCPYIWLISLCFLLHRRDLLPRVANLVDGPDEENAGEDVLIEEMLSYDNQLERYETNVILGVKPFRPLFRAYMTRDKQESLSKINDFLKVWYKDLAAAPWHDSHKEGAGGGYYGYWAFEAAAAVILLEIEDDSNLHQYLYYPKDLVAFARSFDPQNDPSLTPKTNHPTSVKGGEPAPKSGYWFTPAKENSRRYFNEGDIFPKFDLNDWGIIHWQWDGER